MSATATAPVSRSAKRHAPEATATATPEATAATPDAYPGALPPEATATPEATTTATATPEATTTAPTLQESIVTQEATAPPRVSADDVLATQKDCFARVIARSAALAIVENVTAIDNGFDLQEAIDAFKPIVPKRDWWRQRADTISDFEARYRLQMNGRTPEAYKWLTCFHLSALASATSNATIMKGRDGRPFPIATINAIGSWLTYDKASDEWSIRDGYEHDLDVIIARVADDGLTAAQTEEAMKAIDASKRIASAEATGGAKAKANEAKAQKAKAKANRSKALDKAMDTLAKAVASDTVGGASAAELLNKLADRGLAEATGLVDPNTMTPTEALAFSQRLCELDRADVIFVILTRLRAYEANALASDKATADKATASANAA